MSDDMLPEYDFSHAVRGQHRKALDEGYTITIHQVDGSTVVKHYKLKDKKICRIKRIPPQTSTT